MENKREDGTDRGGAQRKTPKVLERRIISDAQARSAPRALPLAVLSVFFIIVFLAYLYTQGFFDKGIVPTPPPASRAARKPQEPSVVIGAAQSGVAVGKKIEEASKLVKSGDCAAAVPILKEVLALDASRADVKRALAGCLNTLGSLSYKDGSFVQAREYFGDASLYDPDPIIVKNLANTRIKLKEFAGAASAIESLPDKDRDRGQLLDVYHQLVIESGASGDHARAAEFARRALAIAPDDARFKDIQAMPEGGALKPEKRRAVSAAEKIESGMTRVDGGHFVVKYDGGENAVTGYVIRILLEEAYLKVGAEFGVYPAETVEALLYTRESFRDITGSPSWAGAVYDGRIKLPAGGISEKTDLLERVIIHEYTHSVVMGLAGGRAPVWLNEGLAQMQEGKKSEGQAALLKRVAKSGKVDLKSLEGSFMRLSNDQAQLAYLLGLSATEFLVGEYGISAVKTILESLKGGKSIDEAFRAGTMSSYDDFQKSWLARLAR